METKVNYAAVGFFVLVLGAALVAGVLWLASGGGWQKKYDLYLAIFDESVSGLNLNAPVKYRGVDVGKVREIALDPANPELVRLTFAIERGTPIKQDTVATLKSQGLTGIAYVELSGGSRASPPLVAKQGEYPQITTKPSLAARLENVLTTVLAKLDSTSTSVTAFLSEENQAAFKSALADMSAVARTLAARKDSLDAGIASAARAFENGARAAADLRPVIERIGPLVERVGRSADAIRELGTEASRASIAAGKTAEGAGKSIDAAGKSVDAAGKSVEAMGADVKRFTSETLPELERLMGEMSALATSLRRLSEQTQENPRGLLFGRKSVPAGPGERAAAR